MYKRTNPLLQSVSLAWKYFSHGSRTTNFFAWVLALVSSQMLFRSKPMWYAFQQRSFNMNQSMISTFFGNNYNHYLKKFYLFSEAEKHGLAYTSQDIQKYISNCPLFWVDGKYNSRKYIAIQKNQKLTAAEIKQAMIILYMADLMELFLSTETASIPMSSHIRQESHKALLIDTSSEPTKRFDQQNPEDLQRFIQRISEDKKNATFTGDDVVCGVIITLPDGQNISKIVKDNNVYSQLESYLIQNRYQSSREINQHIISTMYKNCGVNISSKNIKYIVNDPIGQNPLMFQLMNKPILEVNGKTYMGFITDIKVHHGQEKYKNQQIAIYNGFINKYQDIVRTAHMVSAKNNTNMSLGDWRKTLNPKYKVDEIDVGKNIENPLQFNIHDILVTKINRARFILDRDHSSPVIFIPTKTQVVKKSIPNPVPLPDITHLSIKTIRYQFNSISNYLMDKAQQDSIKQILDQKLSESNLKLLCNALHQIMSKSFKSPTIRILESFCHGLITAYWEELKFPNQNFMTQLNIHLNASIWYNRTIDQSQ